MLRIDKVRTHTFCSKEEFGNVIGYVVLCFGEFNWNSCPLFRLIYFDYLVNGKIQRRWKTETARNGIHCNMSKQCSRHSSYWRRIDQSIGDSAWKSIHLWLSGRTAKILQRLITFKCGDFNELMDNKVKCIKRQRSSTFRDCHCSTLSYCLDKVDWKVAYCVKFQ